MNKKLLIDLQSEEKRCEVVNKLIININVEARKTTINDPLHKIAKQVWMQLQSDIFDTNLQAEFCEFLLEHPDCNIIEIDRLFREEWDL